MRRLVICLLPLALLYFFGCGSSTERPKTGGTGGAGGSAGGGDTGGNGGSGGDDCSLGKVCGEQCCDDGEICGANLSCCPLQDLCGSECCGDGQICENALCRLDCGGTARCHDDNNAEGCCAASELCVNDSCFLPKLPCKDFLDCPDGQYCEPAVGMCLPQPGGPDCESEPTGGAVIPSLVWSWDGSAPGTFAPSSHQVMMAPAVANLNDDNIDGQVDVDDIPDVLFTTYVGATYKHSGILRAVSGTDGSALFDVTDPAHMVSPGGALAVGDIDGDGLVEIVACASDPSGEGPLIAFENDLSFKWKSTDPQIGCGQSGPGIADLDADGKPEVFIRFSVVNGADGSLLWHKDCLNSGRDTGWAHNPCDFTTAADLNGDGKLELVGGNLAFHADGKPYFDRSADFRDGYPAIGDLDLDGIPEVVVVQSSRDPGGSGWQGDHYLRALNFDGTARWGPVDINAGNAPQSDVAANVVGGGGPPTIANFDSDAAPEIAMAGAYGYAVFEPDGKLKWWSATRDRSSRKTGSSVFDFDGDGVAEAVYADEYWLRVYDGTNGDVKYCECNTSGTHWEYPVIVDVNNDSHAEIVVVRNDGFGGYTQCSDSPELGTCEKAKIADGKNLGGHGVRVFASPNGDWVGTRRIWNQHTYHVTNVTEDGRIPKTEPANWKNSFLNNFRQNVQPGALNLSDPVPIELSVALNGCPTSMTLYFSVQNQGWAACPAELPATVYVKEGESWVKIGKVKTTQPLLPGQSEALSIEHTLSSSNPSAQVHFLVVINDSEDDPLPELLECRPENNSAETTGSCGAIN